MDMAWRRNWLQAMSKTGSKLSSWLGDEAVSMAWRHAPQPKLAGPQASQPRPYETNKRTASPMPLLSLGSGQPAQAWRTVRKVGGGWHCFAPHETHAPRLLCADMRLSCSTRDACTTTRRISRGAVSVRHGRACARGRGAGRHGGEALYAPWVEPGWHATLRRAMSSEAWGGRVRARRTVPCTGVACRMPRGRRTIRRAISPPRARSRSAAPSPAWEHDACHAISSAPSLACAASA